MIAGDGLPSLPHSLMPPTELDAAAFSDATEARLAVRRGGGWALMWKSVGQYEARPTRHTYEVIAFVGMIKG